MDCGDMRAYKKSEKTNDKKKGKDPVLHQVHVCNTDGGPIYTDTCQSAVWKNDCKG